MAKTTKQAMDADKDQKQTAAPARVKVRLYTVAVQQAISSLKRVITEKPKIRALGLCQIKVTNDLVIFSGTDIDRWLSIYCSMISCTDVQGNEIQQLDKPIVTECLYRLLKVVGKITDDEITMTIGDTPRSQGKLVIESGENKKYKIVTSNGELEMPTMPEYKSDEIEGQWEFPSAKFSRMLALAMGTIGGLTALEIPDCVLLSMTDGNASFISADRHRASIVEGDLNKTYRGRNEISLSNQDMEMLALPGRLPKVLEEVSKGFATFHMVQLSTRLVCSTERSMLSIRRPEVAADQIQGRAKVISGKMDTLGEISVRTVRRILAGACARMLMVDGEREEYPTTADMDFHTDRIEAAVRSSLCDGTEIVECTSNIGNDDVIARRFNVEYISDALALMDSRQVDILLVSGQNDSDNVIVILPVWVTKEQQKKRPPISHRVLIAGMSR